MKFVLSLAGIIFFILGCEPEYYQLDVSTSGHGTFEITPQKNEYEDGETVLINAIADSGYKFRRWEGSTLSSKSNPLSLVMDGHKNIRVVFGVPVEPDLSGTWESELYPITFEIKQPDPFEKELTGKMIVEETIYGTLVYNIVGFNRSPQVDMNCTKQGFYEVRFSGMIESYNRINGNLTEAGYHLDCDLIRVTDTPLPKKKLPFVFNKIQEEGL